MEEEDPYREQRRIGLGMQLMAWIVIIALLTWYFQGVFERQRNPNQNVHTSITDAGIREVVLERNRQGHYVTSGEINGHPVVFLIDTGATGVAIPGELASRLGVRRGRPYNTVTANGVARSYAARLNSVSVGDIKLYNIDAAITPGMQMEEVLLGMSFLQHIEFTQRNNTLTLRQYPLGAG
jgi:aspartyl protease family protein